MVPAAAAIGDALVVTELVAHAVRVAGVGGPSPSVSPVGPGGPAGPGRRLDRRDGGRTGPGGEPLGGGGSVGPARGQDGCGTAARRPVRRPAARGRRNGGRDASVGRAEALGSDRGHPPN